MSDPMRRAEIRSAAIAGRQKPWSSKERVKFRDMCDELTALALLDTIDAQFATIARLEAENAKLVDLLRVDIITQERDALESENAQMRSLISSRPDAPQAFWDEHRAALESARQQIALYNLAIDKAKP